MALHVLLLKSDPDQTPRDDDLTPPSSDIVARLAITGGYELMLVAEVPDGLNLKKRKRLVLDDTRYLIRAFPAPTHRVEGRLRW